MTPMNSLTIARLAGPPHAGNLGLLDHSAIKLGVLAISAGELQDEVGPGPHGPARVATAGIAGAAFAPDGGGPARRWSSRLSAVIVTLATRSRR